MDIHSKSWGNTAGMSRPGSSAAGPAHPTSILEVGKLPAIIFVDD